MPTGLIVALVVATYLIGFVVTTACVLRDMVANSEFCHTDLNFRKRGCVPGAASSYYGNHGPDCWGYSKTGKVESWMLWECPGYVLLWPLAVLPYAALRLANHKPIPAAEMRRLKKLEEDYERERVRSLRA